MSMGHSMGGMSMGDGVPSPSYLQKLYWAFIGTAIGCATLVNVYNKTLYRQRISAASRNVPCPAKPRAVLPSTVATIFAIAREFACATYPLPLSKRLRWTSPTLGRVSAVLAELVLVLVLCFYKLNPNDQWQWEDIGYRTGYIAAAQLPLVVLLAGKRNIIGCLSGTSYERLNWLHRWVSRILFLNVTIHMGFWFVGWARYDYIKMKLTTDAITQRGFAAWCILLWIVLSSLAPARRWNYEFFVVQHIITFVGFFAAVYLHLPAEVKIWVWLSIGLFLLDRLLRALATLLINVPLLNRRKTASKVLGSWATFESLSESTTRITIENPPFRWKAGQHVFLSCHGLAPLQAHPFTIASIPADKKLEFLVKSKSGSTKRFFQHAEKMQGLPQTSADLRQPHQRSVILEGPYGRIRPLRQFDSVFLIAGSSGATFTIPLMRDVVSNWMEQPPGRGLASGTSASKYNGAVTRYIRFIWVIKSRSQYAWFASHLKRIRADVQEMRDASYEVEVEMSIYITCDEMLGGGDEIAERRTSVDPMHSSMEQVTTTQSPSIEFEKGAIDLVSVSSVASNSDIQDGAVASCGPNGTCCCMQTIEDEGRAIESGRQCHCHCGTDEIQAINAQAVVTEPSISKVEDVSEVNTDKKEIDLLLETSAIPMLSGRPKPRKLIREMLEQALGESAIAVCGPQGLIDDVRRSVVALSDERAVHKGTGAQGIYLHAESFEY
ncbi:MAG: hypothetical protein Q9186_000529 [Xanthomendoza sp. 1 TL-2023]